MDCSSSLRAVLHCTLSDILPITPDEELCRCSCTSDFPPQYLLLRSQSPMVPRCALPPRPRPSFWRPSCLADWVSCIQIAWFFACAAWADKDDHGLPPLFPQSSIASRPSPFARQNRQVLAAWGGGGVRCPEISRAQQNCSRCVLVRILQNWVPQSGGLWGWPPDTQYKLFEAAMAVAVA